MRDGQKDGRVTIERVLKRTSVGLGALEGLRGEVLVVDGTAWVGRTDSFEVVVERAKPDDQAALLVLADVEAWRSSVLGADASLDSLDPRGTGSPVTVPFIVRGDFADVELHVLAGRCPYGPEEEEGDEPVRRTFSAARGTLVGFVTDEAPGIIAHHGRRVHAHVLLEEPEPYVGHVDGAVVLAGSTLLVPAR